MVAAGTRPVLAGRDRARLEALAGRLEEPPFLRRVFEELGPAATGRCGLVPAFGYDFVPGNLAGALALAEAAGRATRVTIGYFVTGLERVDA
jgi:hypothetical protein